VLADQIKKGTKLVLLDRKVGTKMKADDMCKVLQEIHDFKYAKTKLEKLLLWHDHNCRKMRD